MHNLIAGNQPFDGGARVTLSGSPASGRVLIAGNGPGQDQPVNRSGGASLLR